MHFPLQSAVFTRNFPYDDSHPVILSTPQRVAAHPAYTGRGVVMAFIDSGFYPHPDLGNRVLAYADATGKRVVERNSFKPGRWYSWHGQMTSVIAAGDGRLSGGRYCGIAFDAHLVLVKVTNARGQIKEPDIARGLRWVLDNARRFNIRVVNLSVGGDFPSRDAAHPIYQLVAALMAQGIVVVCAAGNSGHERLVPPASAPDSITVGGYNDGNTLDQSRWTAYHNDYGVAYDGTSKPEITAPAAWIASPILPGSTMEREARWLVPMLEAHADDEEAVGRLLKAGHTDLHMSRAQATRPTPAVYTMLQGRIAAHKLVDMHHQHVDGTSVAAAIASSVVAQLLEANPSLTPAQVKTVLMHTATPLPDVPAAQQGAGRLGARNAVELALRLRNG